MDESALERLIERAGLKVDHGNLIDGPFIPDGTVRIYDPEKWSHVLGSGNTLAEAFESAAVTIEGEERGL